MRLSFKTNPQETDWDALERIWRAAEDLPELSAGWSFDHFYPIMTNNPGGPCFEGWTMLAYLAGITERLRLGLMVTGNTYRHPAVLANMCATVDVVSKGRLEIGLGAAWNAEEHDAYGIAFPPLKDRMDALEEACQVLDSLLTQRHTTFEGKHYRLTDAYCEPKPVQQPRPPLVIGGAGEQRTMRIAARWADHWNFPGRTGEDLRPKLEVFHQRCAEIERDPAEIEVSMHLFEPLEPGPAAEQARDLVAAGCTHVILYLRSPFDEAKLRSVTRAVADAIG